MSFKIFYSQLFGKIKPVEKIESNRHSLYRDYLEYLNVDNSEELKEFLELEKFVRSDEFKSREEQIKHLRFKGSPEEELLKEYEKLKNASHIKKFFKLKDSSDMRRFEALIKSDKIREFNQLTEYVDNGSFNEEKEEMRRQVYRGSDEEEHLKEYNKLKKSSLIKIFLQLHGSKVLSQHEKTAGSEKLKKYYELKDLPEADKEKKREFSLLKRDTEIKQYLKFENSRQLRLYKESLESYDLKKFNELKEVVESETFKKRVYFLKDKKKFGKTEAYKKWKRLNELSSGSDVKFYLKFEKSALLKNYYDVKESYDLKRFLELKEIITSDEYLKRKAYLEDVKKWEKSDEYAKQQKYNDMLKLPHLVKYFKYKGTDAFKFFTDWEISFEDDFTAENLNNEKWSPLSFWAAKGLNRNFSMPGDLQAYTNGENIKAGGRLVIETKKEKAEGLVWQMPAGLVPSQFEYTSGLVSSGNSFWQKDGIFEAKIKFSPVKEVVSSFVLQGENSTPKVHLIEMGMKNRLGISLMNDQGKLIMNGLDISNLRKGKWYIFTIEKAGNTCTWKINEREVLKLDQVFVDSPLHINILSIVVDRIPGSKLPVRFQADWVRCYKKR